MYACGWLALLERLRGMPLTLFMLGAGEPRRYCSPSPSYAEFSRVVLNLLLSCGRRGSLPKDASEVKLAPLMLEPTRGAVGRIAGLMADAGSGGGGMPFADRH